VDCITKLTITRKMDYFGRVPIPKVIREGLGIVPGDLVEFELKDIRDTRALDSDFKIMIGAGFRKDLKLKKGDYVTLKVSKAISED
jgi:AbrB family looped-hinge helix DNA binding protein